MTVPNDKLRSRFTELRAVKAVARSGVVREEDVSTDAIAEAKAVLEHTRVGIFIVAFQAEQRQPSELTLVFVRVRAGTDVAALRERIERDNPQLVTVRTASDFGRALISPSRNCAAPAESSSSTMHWAIVNAMNGSPSVFG